MKPRRIALAAIALAAIVVLLYGPLYSKYRDLNKRNEDLSIELASVRARLAALRREKYLLENDPHYMEKVLRDELGLARPGEEVYKIAPAQK